MKHFFRHILSFILLYSSFSPLAAQVQYEVIPLPQSITYTHGAPFILTPNTKIVYPQGDADLQQVAELLSQYLSLHTGRPLALTDALRSNEPVIRLSTGYTEGQEGAYNLYVSENEIHIQGSGVAGVLHGAQTLRKSLPVGAIQQRLSLPSVHIKDAPRFAYRGMHLDVARHFWPLDFIKRYIDILALHNMNYLHLHLTDDQGWRVEIKKHPKLTEIGAWRKETLIGKSQEYDGIPHGGFYTQEELKELVAYAGQRQITIIPEVDLPGHMSAVLACYPELGCTGGPYEVATKWGVFDEVLCAGNEQIYTFLEEVFTELIQIFPSPYIHIGGDECTKHRWEACPHCQAKIKELGLLPDDQHSAEQKLQAYVISRVGAFLNSQGRSIIGWDEILDGAQKPNAIIMAWHGHSSGAAAAKQGLKAIMVPSSYAYFDFYQTLNIANVPLALGGHLP